MDKKNFIFIGILILGLHLSLKGQRPLETYVEKKSDTYINLSGKVFYDQNKNESYDNEPILRGWFVKAENTTTGHSILTATDETGQYQFNLPFGTYNIIVITPNRYWLPSQQNIKRSVSDSTLDFAIKAVAISPAMQVDLAAPIFQSCSENTYTIRYANNGTATATDAFVELNLDASLSFAGATLPLTAQYGRTLRFYIGHVAPNDFGSFTIKTRAACETGAVSEQNLCSDVHIFPDTLSGMASRTANIVRVGTLNGAGYKKSHIIIEDVIIFYLPTDDNYQTNIQSDSAFMTKQNFDRPQNDSTNSMDNRLALQAVQTAFFGDYPQRINTPSAYHLCHPMQIRANLSTQNPQLGRATTSNKTVVYPNPMSETATFEINNNTESTYQLLIFDSIGQLTRTEYFTGNKLLFHRKDLSAGVYFYKIMNQNTPLSIGSIFITD